MQSETKRFCWKRLVKQRVFVNKSVFAKIWLCGGLLNLVLKHLEILDVGLVYSVIEWGQKNVEKNYKISWMCT
jgi:hypothetical protein